MHRETPQGERISSSPRNHSDSICNSCETACLCPGRTSIILGVKAFLSTNRSFGLRWSIRAPMGTRIWRLPFFTEIERAVETSMVGSGSEGSSAVISSGSVTRGTRIGSGWAGWGVGSGAVGAAFSGDSVLSHFVSGSCSVGSLTGAGSDNLVFSSFAGSGGAGSLAPVLIVRFGRLRRDFTVC